MMKGVEHGAQSGQLRRYRTRINGFGDKGDFGRVQSGDATKGRQIGILVGQGEASVHARGG